MLINDTQYFLSLPKSPQREGKYDYMYYVFILKVDDVWLNKEIIPIFILFFTMRSSAIFYYLQSQFQEFHGD